MKEEQRGTFAALVVFVMISIILGVVLFNSNSARIAAENKVRYATEQLRETEAALAVAELKLEDNRNCAAQAIYYRVALEGLAAKMVTMLESGYMPDLTPELDAKKAADEITCE